MSTLHVYDSHSCTVSALRAQGTGEHVCKCSLCGVNALLGSEVICCISAMFKHSKYLLHENLLTLGLGI